MTITPSTHDRSEWARMAQSAYQTGHNFYGHRYSAWAARSGPIGQVEYDALQLNYRLWLLHGWAHFDLPDTLPWSSVPTVEAR